MQAAAGILVHPPGYLRAIRELTRRLGILLMADEIAVGFGRAATLFACEQEAVCPDILILSKGLTGGYLPLAATLTTDEIYDAFLGEPWAGRTFYHGHTYTGNPLASVAALASLFAGIFATFFIALFAPPLAEFALLFGPAEYFSLMLLGLLAAIVLAQGSVIKALGMMALGLLLSAVGTDVESGVSRMTLGLPQLADGISIVPMAG